MFFYSSRLGRRGVYKTAADGTANAELVAEANAFRLVFVNAVTDEVVLFRGPVPGRQNDLGVIALSNAAVAEPLLGSEASERNAALSPDGRWIAYDSDVSGRYEVWVRPFPSVSAGLHQVSTSGGTTPAWSPDGSEVYYREPRVIW